MNMIDEYLSSHNPKSVKQYITSLVVEQKIDFFAIMLEAHVLTLQEKNQKRPSYIHKNWVADTFYGNIIGKFRDYYPLLMDIDSEGKPYLRLAKDVRVYFKKLDEKYKPNNIQTNAIIDMWAQKLKGLEGGKTHVLYIGYVLLGEQWEELKGIYGSYPSDFYKKKIEWVIDMSEYSHQIQLPSTGTEINTEEIIVKPKTKDNDKIIGNENI